MIFPLCLKKQKVHKNNLINACFHINITDISNVHHIDRNKTVEKKLTIQSFAFHVYFQFWTKPESVQFWTVKG